MAWKVDAEVVSDRGLARPHNEDDYLLWENQQNDHKGLLLAIADGMGGHAAGERASKLAIQIIKEEYFSDQNPDRSASLERAIQAANQGIFYQGNTSPEFHGMGCTIVAALILEDRLVVAHVGDSRAYLVRGNRIVAETEDHNWVVEALKQGIITPEQAVDHPNRNRITRNLGGGSTVAVEMELWAPQEGDMLLLCSDGLNSMVDDARIVTIMSAGTAVTQVTKDLLSAALAAGGLDNITVIVARLHTALPDDLKDTLPYKVTRPLLSTDLAITVDGPPDSVVMTGTPPPNVVVTREETSRQRLPGRGWRWLIERFRRQPVGMALVVVVILTALVLLIAQPGRGNGPPRTPLPTSAPTATRKATATPKVLVPTVPVTTLTAVPLTTAVPDRSSLPERLAYARWDDGARWMLHVAEVAWTGSGPSLQQDVLLPKSANLTHPTWDPSGQWLIAKESKDGQVIETEGQLYLLGAVSDVCYLLIDENRQAIVGSAPDWSPDGQWLAYSREGAIWRCRVELASWRCLNETLALSNCQGACANLHPSWAPDSQWLAVTRLAVNYARVDLYMPNARGDIWKVNIEDQSDAAAVTDTPPTWDAFPDWGPTGLLAWSSEEPFAVRTERSGTWRLTGVHPAWSPRGDWIVSVFVANEDPSTWRLNFVKADGSIHLNGDGTDFSENYTGWPGLEPAWWGPPGSAFATAPGIQGGSMRPESPGHGTICWIGLPTWTRGGQQR